MTIGTGYWETSYTLKEKRERGPSERVRDWKRIRISQFPLSQVGVADSSNCCLERWTNEDRKKAPRSGEWRSVVTPGMEGVHARDAELQGFGR